MYLSRLFNNASNHYKRGGLKAIIVKIPDHIRFLIRERKVSSQYLYTLYQKNVEPQVFAKYLPSEQLAYRPKISIIMPLFNVPNRYLKKAVKSIESQTYDNWELCIHDDASTENLNNLDFIEAKAALDQRIKFTKSEVNENISGASNNALESATGEYLVLMDNDDEIDPRALEVFVNALNKDRDLKYIYSDFDKIETNGSRTEPYFKPDWSPYSLLAQMYTNHLHMFETQLVKDIGGFRKGYEGSQDYDLVLRYTERLKDEQIMHIPVILYHWRKIPGSTAVAYSEKSNSRVAAKKALEDTLKRRKIEGVVEDGFTPPSFRIRYKLKNEKIAIIIPTYNKYKVLKTNIDSILQKSTYENYEIIVMDNNSDEQSSINFLSEISKDPKIRVLSYKKQFNFSAINNFAVKQTDAQQILFLNNDVEIINSDWLEALLELSQLEDTGAIGAMLLYHDRRIQHAGVVTGIQGVAGHSYKNYKKEELFHRDKTHVIRNVSAVTAACLMVKKRVFEEVGGFDENLRVAFNDVDLCLKIDEVGYSNLYTPFAQLYHYESLSRGSDQKPERLKEFQREILDVQRRWGDRLAVDPYYSVNLSLDYENSEIRIR